MGQLIDGEWRNEPPQVSGSGEFVPGAEHLRMGSAGDDPDYPAVPGRYHLYVAAPARGAIGR